MSENRQFQILIFWRQKMLETLGEKRDEKINFVHDQGAMVSALEMKKGQKEPERDHSTSTHE